MSEISHEEIVKISLDNDAPWVLIALRDFENGVKRIKGPKNHPRILEYWTYTNYNPRTDEESFCAAGMNAWIFESGYEGTRDPAARSFMDLPRIKQFKPGCICVFERGFSSWQGHVNLGLVEFDDTILCIGANQGEKNEVNIKHYKKEKLLGYYWPKRITK